MDFLDFLEYFTLRRAGETNLSAGSPRAPDDVFAVAPAAASLRGIS